MHISHRLFVCFATAHGCNWYAYFQVAPAALGNVHTLVLEHASALFDVQALGNHHSISISGCAYLEDVDSLANVHSVALTRCNRNIDSYPLDVSMLKAHTLDLEDSFVKGVSSLQGVHSLSLK
eukprot:Opistho-2@14784